MFSVRDRNAISHTTTEGIDLENHGRRPSLLGVV